MSEEIIPKYAFEPDEATGNQMLRISRNSSVQHYKKSDFLIPHRKDYYFMAFVRKGSSRHWVDMTAYDLKPDTFYFTVPNQVNMKEQTEPITGVVLNFNDDFISSDNNGLIKDLPIIQNPFNGHVLSLKPEDLDFLEDIFDRILLEYQSTNSWQHNMLLAYMKVLLIYLSRLYMEQYSERELIPDRIILKKYLSKIEESYIKSHEVAEYAEMLNMSANHLSEVVKEQSGKPAIVHIHNRIILEAKRLLFHTDYAVKEIAYQLGFEEPSYFNRFFKRITSYTPVAYRENFRKMYH